MATVVVLFALLSSSENPAINHWMAVMTYPDERTCEQKLTELNLQPPLIHDVRCVSVAIPNNGL